MNISKIILIAISVFILLSIVYTFQFLLPEKLDNVASNIKEKDISIDEFVQQYAKIDSIGSKSKNRYYYLSEADLNSIKQIVTYIKIDTEKTIQNFRYEIDNTIDRVNIYISIGIVLLTLMGLFIPVTVQHFSSEDINKKLKKLEIMADRNEKQVEYIPPLKLAYSLQRAISKDSIRYFHTNPSSQETYLKKIYKLIKNDIEECKKKNLYPFDNDFLRSCLELFLSDLDIVIQTSQTRRNIDEIRELKSHFTNIISNNNGDRSLYDNLIVYLDNIST